MESPKLNATNMAFLTEIFLSGKIIRKTKIFPVFLEIFPIFAVLTLLPVQKKRRFYSFSREISRYLFHKIATCTMKFREIWNIAVT